MKQFFSKNLNLPRLLTLGDLDVRGVAEVNEKLTAHEYFSWVEWFIEDAPDYIETLKRASNLKSIEKIKVVLSEIGYENLQKDIDSMINFLQIGGTEQAKKQGAEISDKLISLCERLRIAYSPKNRRSSQVKTEWFIEEAPQYIELLKTTSDCEEIKKIKRILSRIGYDSLNSDIDNMINEIQKEETADVAKISEMGTEISDKLSTYYERVKSAYLNINQKFAQSLTVKAQHSSEEAYEEPLLKEALEYLDFEEAHRKLRVLAVDDNNVVLNSVTSILNPYYEVFALTKASQVEKFLTHTTPELFLLDIEMPEMNGYDLLSVIRSFSEHKDTPIIFLTGSATLENIKTAVSLGASDFIKKPINRDTLIKKIESKIIWKKSF